MKPNIEPQRNGRCRPILTRRDFLIAAAGASAAAATAWAAPSLAEAPTDAEDRPKVEAALPAKAPAVPRKPRKLLIFDLNVQYGGHRSIPTANLAFTLMGKKTGAFETVVSRDPAVFQKESLRQFDAVFLNNTVGNLFTDPQLRQNLLEFVYGGGGLMGVHGTSVAFTRWGEGAKEDWPEFAIMLGMRGAYHRANTELVSIKLDDPGHPLVAPFGGKGFDFRDEFFRPQGTYSRRRDRVLLAIDTDKTDLSKEPHDRAYRADGDYALSWVRQYGRGRIFYTAFGHNPYVFWDAKMLEYYLGAAQFILGDLPAPTIPSGLLTPAIRAQEKLSWPLLLEATAGKCTLFDAIDRASKLGLPFAGAAGSQNVSKEIAKPFAPGLSEEELQQVRLKLDSAAVRLLTYSVPQAPPDAAGWREIFDFGRKIGVDTLLAPPPADAALADVGKLCDEYDLPLAVDIQPTPVRSKLSAVRPLEAMRKVCQGGERIGLCLDLGSQLRAGGEDLFEIPGAMKDRVLAVRLHDLTEHNAQGRDTVLGRGANLDEFILNHWVFKLGRFLAEVSRLGLRPTFSIPQVHGGLESLDDIAASVEWFNQACLKLAK